MYGTFTGYIGITRVEGVFDVECLGSGLAF